MNIFQEFVEFAKKDRRFNNLAASWMIENAKLMEVAERSKKGSPADQMIPEEKWRTEYDLALKGRSKYDRELRSMALILWQDFLLQKIFDVLEKEIKSHQRDKGE